MEQFKGSAKTLFIWTQSSLVQASTEKLQEATGGEVILENINRLTFGKSYFAKINDSAEIYLKTFISQHTKCSYLRRIYVRSNCN